MQKLTLSATDRYKDVAYTKLHKEIQEKVKEGWKRDGEPKDFLTNYKGRTIYIVEQNMVK